MTPSHAPVSAGLAGARRSAAFAGASVFLSRNLVAPEVYDAVHDALRLNGAEVFLCADPGRTGPLDFHVISSASHEKFADLKARGCNLIGPQCVISCANERRSLPKQSYTCCLAMDGVKILSSGFEKAEKAKIKELVTAMGGLLHANQSTDVDFVIVKDVTAAKYKWAVDNLKKPVVTMDWLEKCWMEHRVVPHEPHRILPFTGLNICVTKLDNDKRRELKKIVLQNGGQFSHSLTRKCTHLVATEPGGEKYIVAKNWGHIHIVNPKWVDQCVARRACIDESSYLVQSSSPLSGIKVSLKEQHNPQISSASASFQSAPTITMDDSSSQFVPASLGDAAKNSNTDIVAASSVQETNQMQIYNHVAEDSEAEYDDLYLSNCRISLVGFDEKEMLRLVMMIRNGGGSRHILLSEKLTHIVLGTPSEDEKREVRRLASWGVINLVKATWLEDCSKSKKEVKISSIHLATDLVLREYSHMSMEKSADTQEMKVAKSSCGLFHVPTVNEKHGQELEKDLPSERKPARAKHDNMNKTRAARSAKSSQQNGTVSISEHHPSAQVTSETNSGSSKSSNVFKGKTFDFSNSFPHDQRPEVVDWIRDGGGTLVDNVPSTHVDFIIEGHGRSSIHCDFSCSTIVSSHWIRSCLMEGRMQDVGDHPIFTPLHCQIPFPGFEKFRFCISRSQYEEKEWVLFKNLCRTLQVKLTFKASDRVTHFFCKFATGEKYNAYSKRGTPTITAEWLFECIKQDTIVPFDNFQPKPQTSQDKDAGLCTVSQYSTQGASFDCSEPLSRCQVTTNNTAHKSGIAIANEETTATAVNKRRKLSIPSKAGDMCENIGRTERQMDSSSVPDVADAIEVLSSKLQDVQSPRSIFKPDDSAIVQEQKDTESSGISRSWLNMQQKQDNTLIMKVPTNSSPIPSSVPAAYFPFSETTESQIVGYEEDLTGMQKIIDRVRSQSSNMTPSNEMRILR